MGAFRLITVAEVFTKAMTNTNSTDQSLVKDEVIAVSQLRWIMPVLGADLWDEMETEWDTTGSSSGLSANNLILFNRLTSAMAYFVKYEVIPDMSINQTSAGLQTLNTEFSNAATDTQRREIREQALTHAQVYLKEFIRWIEDSDNLSTYPLYDTNSKSGSQIKNRGGIIF